MRFTITVDLRRVISTSLVLALFFSGTGGFAREDASPQLALALFRARGSR